MSERSTGIGDFRGKNGFGEAKRIEDMQTMKPQIRLGDAATTKHLYCVETTKGNVKVDANNRNSAAVIAKRAGYTVKSVNMIG